jgi:hypothetical protein
VTPQEIQFAALKQLGVVNVHGTPSAEQGVDAASKYASLHAMLLDDGLAWWALTEEIPAKAEQPVMDMLAYLCAADARFGALERQQELAPLGALGLPGLSLAERKLRALNARDYVSQPVQSEYF